MRQSAPEGKMQMALRVLPPLPGATITRRLSHEDRIIVIDRVRSLDFGRVPHGTGWHGGPIQYHHWHHANLAAHRGPFVAAKSQCRPVDSAAVKSIRPETSAGEDESSFEILRLRHSQWACRQDIDL
jgi:hypothetical protein